MRNMYRETKVWVIIGAMLLPLHLRNFHLHKHHMEKCFCCQRHRYHLSSDTRWGRERMEGNGQRNGERGCAMQSNWYVNPSLGWTAAQWLNAVSDFIATMHLVFNLTAVGLLDYYNMISFSVKGLIALIQWLKSCLPSSSLKTHLVIIIIWR